MKKVFFSSLILTALLGGLFYSYLSLPDVAVLKQRNPKSSALMELRAEEYKQKNIRVARQQI
ncbi:MAG TPA: monofunctional biosynthetic peptidoglycan transglycosylase, partial [Candidatus Binatia bacterium]|nr:monofunctional biosynthetic peptidoglycan transglycosylase [Candidatus Binatia bacterium]